MTTSQTPTVEARVSDLLSQMTLAEKIGQMTQIEKNSITPDTVAEFGIGSVLSGGGGNPTPNTPQTWASMVRAFEAAALESRLRIPILYGSDAVHGHNNVVGATIFPHNVGLGAAHDPDLVSRAARVTARECLATNVQWAFAPAVSVPQDTRWGRSFEGFSEATDLVSQLGVASVLGLQNGRFAYSADGERPVLASVKHYVGDGGTAWGSTPSYEWIPDWWKNKDTNKWKLDQGDMRVDEATVRAVHLPPYQAAIAAGARNIMVSYSSWQGVKMHAQRYLLTDVLKGELGFDGFLISDWLATSQLHADFYTSIVMTINAGLDMIMVPYDSAGFITNMTKAVASGDISLQRIDDAVRRILRVKLELGLFEHPFGDETLLAQVGCAAHRQVAREAVRQSLVLLKNENGALPLLTQAHLLVAGTAADDIGMQCGGWTIEWQGKSGAITPGTTLLDALKPRAEITYRADGQFAERAAVGLVVLNEPPYAEGDGDRATLSLSDDDIALVERVRAQCDKLVVVLYSGRPLPLDEIFDQCDALVAAWLPGTEAAGIADGLTGATAFSGKLAYRWPRKDSATPRFPLGYGLSL